MEVVELEVFFDFGIWYFLVFLMFEDFKEYLNWIFSCIDFFEEVCKGLVIGLVFQCSYIVIGDDVYYVVII